MRATKQGWRPAPCLIVFATALSVIAFMVCSSWLSARRNRLNARVEIADPLIEAAAAQSQPIQVAHVLPDGEMERTAARVREVSAMVAGLTLLAVNEAIASRPAPTVQSLTDRFVARGLLPPGISRHAANGVFESERGLIYVRYRPEPPAIEVVSIGRAPLDGPAIVGRLATGTDNDSGAVLFIASRISGSPLPEPFAPTSQVAAMGWSVEPLRERTFSPLELEQVNAWLRTQSNDK